MKFFSEKGYPSYAISMRGSGNSHNPGYLRTVFWTTAYQLAEDVAAAVHYVRSQHAQDVPSRVGDGLPVLMGHSNGAGVCQKMLNEKLAKCAALVTLAGTPNFGGYVYVLLCFTYLDRC